MFSFVLLLVLFLSGSTLQQAQMTLIFFKISFSLLEEDIQSHAKPGLRCPSIACNIIVNISLDEVCIIFANKKKILTIILIYIFFN